MLRAGGNLPPRPRISVLTTTSMDHVVGAGAALIAPEDYYVTYAHRALHIFEDRRRLFLTGPAARRGEVFPSNFPVTRRFRFPPGRPGEPPERGPRRQWHGSPRCMGSTWPRAKRISRQPKTRVVMDKPRMQQNAAGLGEFGSLHILLSVHSKTRRKVQGVRLGAR